MKGGGDNGGLCRIETHLHALLKEMARGGSNLISHYSEKNYWRVKETGFISLRCVRGAWAARRGRALFGGRRAAEGPRWRDLDVDVSWAKRNGLLGVIRAARTCARANETSTAWPRGIELYSATGYREKHAEENKPDLSGDGDIKLKTRRSAAARRRRRGARALRGV